MPCIRGTWEDTGRKEAMVRSADIERTYDAVLPTIHLPVAGRTRMKKQHDARVGKSRVTVPVTAPTCLALLHRLHI